MDALNSKEHDKIQKYFESLGEYIYKFSKDKKRACVFVQNQDDEVLIQTGWEFAGGLPNFNLVYEYVMINGRDNLEDLKAIYAFILIIDISYNHEKRGVKLEKINENILKVTYYITGNKMTYKDLFTMEGNFSNTLYKSEYKNGDTRLTLKEQYSYLELPEKRSVLLSEVYKKGQK